MSGTKCPAPNVRYQMSGTKCAAPNVRYQMSGTKCPAPKVRYQMSGTKCPAPNVRYHMSGTKCPAPNVRYHMSGTKCPVPNIRPKPQVHQTFIDTMLGRPSHCSITFVKDSNNEFNEKLTNGLLAETGSQTDGRTDRRTDGVLLRKYRLQLGCSRNCAIQQGTAVWVRATGSQPRNRGSILGSDKRSFSSPAVRPTHQPLQ
jgi:hypothetical protein